MSSEPGTESEDDSHEPENKESSFLVREEYVLAHSNNVDLIANKSFAGHALVSELRFFKMITKRQMPNMFEDILYQNDLVRPLAPKTPDLS